MLRIPLAYLQRVRPIITKKRDRVGLSFKQKSEELSVDDLAEIGLE